MWSIKLINFCRIYFTPCMWEKNTFSGWSFSLNIALAKSAAKPSVFHNVTLKAPTSCVMTRSHENELAFPHFSPSCPWPLWIGIVVPNLGSISNTSICIIWFAYLYTFQKYITQVFVVLGKRSTVTHTYVLHCFLLFYYNPCGPSNTYPEYSHCLAW